MIKCGECENQQDADQKWPHGLRQRLTDTDAEILFLTEAGWTVGRETLSGCQRSISRGLVAGQGAAILHYVLGLPELILWSSSHYHLTLPTCWLHALDSLGTSTFGPLETTLLHLSDIFKSHLDSIKPRRQIHNVLLCVRIAAQNSHLSD